MLLNEKICTICVYVHYDSSSVPCISFPLFSKLSPLQHFSNKGFEFKKLFLFGAPLSKKESSSATLYTAKLLLKGWFIFFSFSQISRSSEIHSAAALIIHSQEKIPTLALLLFVDGGEPASFRREWKAEKVFRLCYHSRIYFPLSLLLF